MTLPVMTSSLFAFIGYLLLIYMVFVIFTYTFMLFTALLKLKKERRFKRHWIDEENLEMEYAQPVTIIVPAYNEEAGILENLYSLLTLQYPQFEIIVVNDGSVDQTEERVIQHFQMNAVTKVIPQHLQTKQVTAVYQSVIHPNLTMITKENGGKADALNVGINASIYPYFCSIDGDSILNKTSLLRVMKPVIESNKEVIATGGNVRIANGSEVAMGTVTQVGLPEQSLVVMQIIEYMRAFIMGRIALSRFNLVLIISGAFSVFSKKWAIKVGGYSADTVGEDMELVVKLHKETRKHHLDKEIVFTADPVCWTEAPSAFKDLGTQRKRWHQGLAQSLWKHKTMLFNPRYGAVGMISFPYFLFIELLGPIVELGGYVYVLISLFMGDVYYPMAFLLSLLFILYGSVFSMTAVLLEAWSRNSYPKGEDLIRLSFLSLTEVFWYRPFSLLWRLEGIFNAIRGKKEWGTIHRTGLQYIKK